MTERERRPRRRVDGVLLLDKAAGLSSNAALQCARRLYNAAKAGHAGTLDPLATGLLPVCFGEATKFAQGLLDAPKRYRASIRFGAATTTGDEEGAVVERGFETVDATALRTALAGFVGSRMQLPPRYAALKLDGRPYYSYARAGVDIPREPRRIEIHALELVEHDAGVAVVDVVCSKGTYVRVLAEDLARALGTCAHLRALRRTGSGDFDVRDAVELETLEAIEDAQRDALLRPVDELIAALPRVDVDAGTATALRRGRPIARGLETARLVRAYGASGELLGILERDGDVLRPRRLLRTD